MLTAPEYARLHLSALVLRILVAETRPEVSAQPSPLSNVAGSPPNLGSQPWQGTFGFGAVLAVGSVVLRQIFNVVAATRSSETFVAAALLVAVGMGAAAQELGLSTTTGAFAAGVLLAGSQYRQQIEADIKPFEGILLGIFFMTAGANLDPGLCIAEWPTLLSGIIAFLAAKLGLIFALGAFAFGLSRAEAIRIALLLAGGGEFAFVVFKLAETLGLLEPKLSNLLTASVILSMSLTPLLGELATFEPPNLPLVLSRPRPSLSPSFAADLCPPSPSVS